MRQYSSVYACSAFMGALASKCLVQHHHLYSCGGDQHGIKVQHNIRALDPPRWMQPGWDALRMHALTTAEVRDYACSSQHVAMCAAPPSLLAAGPQLLNSCLLLAGTLLGGRCSGRSSWCHGILAGSATGAHSLGCSGCSSTLSSGSSSSSLPGPAYRCSSGIALCGLDSHTTACGSTAGLDGLGGAGLITLGGLGLSGGGSGLLGAGRALGSGGRVC
mmetsp:Transcript_25765/g.56137  ORF Transcript_25765/g.56137 Transcript_25765/m.56137 type:complete len:218 (+) Transcript_25765:470-1123(+)